MSGMRSGQDGRRHRWKKRTVHCQQPIWTITSIVIIVCKDCSQRTANTFMKIHFAVNSPELSWIHHSDWTWANCPEGPEARVPAHFDAARIRPLRGANAGSKECKVCCSHMHIESTHFPTDHHSYTDTLSVWKYVLLIHYLIRASVHLKETTLFNPQNVCVAPPRYMHIQVVLLDKNMLNSADFVKCPCHHTSEV